MSKFMKGYKWPGKYKPFKHQVITSEFLVANKKAFCLSEMGCFDSETEYLTPTGWRKFTDYNGGMVAQYDEKTERIEFVTPDKYVKLPCENMIRIKTKYGLDQLLSPEHRVLLKDGKKEGAVKLEVVSAQELLHRHEDRHNRITSERGVNKIAFSGACIPTVFKPADRSGIDMTEEALRLQIAVIADGYFGNNTNRVSLRLKKERKILRLRDLLLKAGIEFSETTPEYEGAKGFHIFRFNAPIRLKEFDARFWDADETQLRVIADEVLHWDGSVLRGDMFFSTSKNSADFIQYVFSSLGYTSRITVDSRDGHKDCYTVRRREQKRLYIVGPNKTMWEEKSTDGFKYCFIVPTSFLLVRRNGCVFVSGNTGKTASVIWASDFLINMGLVKRVLIICPLSIMKSAWQADLFKTAIHRSVAICYGTTKQRQTILTQRTEYVIINPDGVGTVEKELIACNFDLVVVDEADCYKTHTTQKWKTLNRVVKNVKGLWLLTGTPAAQAPTDAYGLAKLVNPDGVPKFLGAFRDMVMTKYGPFKWVPKPNASEIVHKVLQPAIRFEKRDCLDLPPITYTDREVEMTEQQKRYYKEMKRQLLFNVKDGVVSSANAAVLQSKLVQIACIVYNTPVLTDKGWIPIQDVRRSHKIWDGQEWVVQQGTAFKGVKDVVECYGVEMTLDHKVLTDEGWATAEEILNDKQCVRFNRKKVRLPYSYSEGRIVYRKVEMREVVMPLRLWKRSDPSKPISKEKTKGISKELRVPSRKRDPQDDKNSTLFELSQYGVSVPQSLRQGLQKLWCAGHRSLLSMEGRVREFLGGYGTYLRKRTYFRQSRQQRALRPLELPLGYSYAAGQQYADKQNFGYPERKINCNASGKSLWTKENNITCKNISVQVGFERCVRKANQQETYDLINCGPRSRFVVMGKEGPLIVHNCGAVYTDDGGVLEFDVSNRLRELKEVIDSTEQKVLVFVPYKHTISLVSEYLLKQKIENEIISGEVGVNKRGDIIDRFQNQEDTKVLVLQPQTTSHGLTLTAANVIVWYAPPPSVRIYMQANGRIDRPGQKHNMSVVHLIGSKAEEKLYRSLSGRLDDFEGLVDWYRQEMSDEKSG